MPMGSSSHPVLNGMFDENLPESQGLVPCLPQFPLALQELTPGSRGMWLNGDT